MREVPPGQHAVIKIGKFSDWKIIETEWGEKYSFPILLLSHPDYPNLDSTRPLETTWESKSIAAYTLYHYIHLTDGTMKEFDWNVDKEFSKKWKLHRFETGQYQLEQM